jgi:serine/threonine protein kinase
MAIAYLHSLGIVHRDIKVVSQEVTLPIRHLIYSPSHQPENVLLDEHTHDVKLADLGLRYTIFPRHGTSNS